MKRKLANIIAGNRPKWPSCALKAALPALVLLQACGGATQRAPLAGSPATARQTDQRQADCKGPVYPKEAQIRNEEGKVTLEFDIRADGTVGEVSVLSSSGSASLDGASIDALKSCRWAPHAASVEPVPRRPVVTYVFELPK